MSNIAPYNEKKIEKKRRKNEKKKNEKKREKKRKKKKKTEPIMNQNVPLTKCKPKQEKKRKNQHMSRIPWQFQCPGFLPFFCISDSSTQRSYRPSYHSLNGSHDN